jgi:8-oxo-dGTP diphosphatase
VLTLVRRLPDRQEVAAQLMVTWDSDRVDRVRVVVGAAIVHDGRLLAARRSSPSALAGGWEFPGGKVDEGETDEDALLRECYEELGVQIKIRDRVGGDWPLVPGVVLRVWLAELEDGEPRPLEDHDELRWLGPGELYDVAWLPGDLPVVDALAQSRLLEGPAA